MAYVAPTTRADGYVIPAEVWNQDAVENVIALKTGTVVLDLVSSAGLVDISAAAAGQIKFPATQNPSTNVNTLDDYEEGSWTPAVGGSGGQSGQAYTVQVGKYVKVGKLVTAYFYIELSTLGTVTTSAQIQGLPFTTENTSNLRPPVVMSYWTNLTGSFVTVGGFAAPNSTAINLYGVETAAATGMSAMNQGDLANTSILCGSITYAATA